MNFNRIVMLNKRRIVGLVILGLAVALVFGCGRESEQDKVKKVITVIQKAAEEKDIGKIRGNISKSYSDPQGNKYENINRLLIGYFYQHPKISIYVSGLNVSVKGASARARVRAILTSKGSGSSSPSILPESLGVYEFDVNFMKESGDWKIVSAMWERVGEGTPGE